MSLIAGMDDVIAYIKKIEDENKKMKNGFDDIFKVFKTPSTKPYTTKINEAIDIINQFKVQDNKSVIDYKKLEEELEEVEDEKFYENYCVELKEQLNEESQQRLKNKECWMSVQKQYHKLNEENKKLKVIVDNETAQNRMLEKKNKKLKEENKKLQEENKKLEEERDELRFDHEELLIEYEELNTRWNKKRDE
jgi:chromosome segregation ATPase